MKLSSHEAAKDTKIAKEPSTVFVPFVFFVSSCEPLSLIASNFPRVVNEFAQRRRGAERLMQLERQQ